MKILWKKTSKCFFSSGISCAMVLLLFRFDACTENGNWMSNMIFFIRNIIFDKKRSLWWGCFNEAAEGKKWDWFSKSFLCYAQQTNVRFCVSIFFSCALVQNIKAKSHPRRWCTLNYKKKKGLCFRKPDHEAKKKSSNNNNNNNDDNLHHLPQHNDVDAIRKFFRSYHHVFKLIVYSVKFIMFIFYYCYCYCCDI